MRNKFEIHIYDNIATDIFVKYLFRFHHIWKFFIIQFSSFIFNHSG